MNQRKRDLLSLLFALFCAVLTVANFWIGAYGTGVLTAFATVLNVPFAVRFFRP